MPKNPEIYLVRDPVCGMKIEPEYAADLDFYKGKIFYFCAPSCKKKFEEDPDKYYNLLFGKDNQNEEQQK